MKVSKYFGLITRQPRLVNQQIVWDDIRVEGVKEYLQHGGAMPEVLDWEGERRLMREGKRERMTALQAEAKAYYGDDKRYEALLRDINLNAILTIEAFLARQRRLRRREVARRWTRASFERLVNLVRR